jgi:predicted RNA binding protein YcfA (HicA-like mRNA interferase family)
MGFIYSISSKKALKALLNIGYRLDHQTGSYLILTHPQLPTLSIPNHSELAPGLLRSVIRQAGLSVEQFLGLLK